MKSRIISLIVIFAILAISHLCVFAQEIILKQTRDNLEILYNQKRVLLYNFETNKLKPYIKELYTLDGRNILLDAPPDHLHHHGLMYAITVNGINFWEETATSGVEYPVRIYGNRTVANDRLKYAEFNNEIYWIARSNRFAASDVKNAFLIENRKLRLIIDAENDVLMVDWTGNFRVGDFAEKVTLSGTDYHGLGLRFVREFDKVAKHFNPANLPYPTGGKHDLIETPWAGVYSKLGDKPVTTAMFTHPDVRGSSVYFCMIDPFAYLSATQGINKKPLVYSKGDNFTVRYLIVVSGSELSVEKLSQIRKNWIEGKYD